MLDSPNGTPTQSDKKKIEALEQELALYKHDPSKRGYFALQKIINQQIDIINNFNLKVRIGDNPKEDKEYDRVKDMWQGLKDMLIDLRTLKMELKINPEEEAAELKKMLGTTPENIADVLGNTAGKRN